MSSKSQANQFEIVDINVNEQSRALFRKDTGGNEWVDLGDKGKEQVLSESEILELSALIKKIEDHYGFPVDVEWAYEEGRFYITQSRPITTLSTPAKKDGDLVEVDANEGVVRIIE